MSCRTLRLTSRLPRSKADVYDGPEEYEPGRSRPGIDGTRKLPSEQATAPRLFLSPMKEPSRAKRSTYERALDMLEARARGADELKRLLLRKGEPVADVDAALQRLTQSGLVDDANYARQLARTKA